MNQIDFVYKRFCRKRFQLPTLQEVETLEERIKVTFPDEYRRFLLAYNGGIFNEPVIIPTVDDCPVDCLTSLYGIHATHPTIELGKEFDLALFDDNDPPEILPIGYTIMGNLIILVTYPDPEEYGSIVLNTTEGKPYFLADDIESFFELIRESE